MVCIKTDIVQQGAGSKCSVRNDETMRHEDVKRKII